VGGTGSAERDWAEGRSAGWVHLGIPKDAVRNVVAKVQQATRYSQAPEYDVFRNVNAVAWGWTNSTAMPITSRLSAANCRWSSTGESLTIPANDIDVRLPR